jgi:hypothetical protein
MTADTVKLLARYNAHVNTAMGRPTPPALLLVLSFSSLFADEDEARRATGCSLPGRRRRGWKLLAGGQEALEAVRAHAAVEDRAADAQGAGGVSDVRRDSASERAILAARLIGANQA